MKFSTVAMLGMAGTAMAATDMATLMALKTKTRTAQREAGLFDKGRMSRRIDVAKCENGKAGEYSCSNVDLLGFLSHETLGSKTREGNDVWGEYTKQADDGSQTKTYFQAGLLRTAASSALSARLTALPSSRFSRMEASSTSVACRPRPETPSGVT